MQNLTRAKIHTIILTTLILFIHFSLSARINKITILTQPIGANHSNGYSGHKAVTRSLIEGLKQTNAIFNYNPQNVSQIYDIVHVLSNIQALQQAIQLKKEGKIKTLIAGPTLVVRPNEYNHLVTSPEIDLYLVNSQWTKQSYIEDEPTLANRIAIWPSGVDVNYWQPSPNTQRTKDVILYIKNQPASFYQKVEELLEKYGWNPIQIHYGKYNHTQYKNLLNKCSFAVFLSKSESQGLALAETWAMNVPTIVWNTKELTAHGKVYSQVSACPYLTQKTGCDWKTIKELEHALQNIIHILSLANPREWVLKNMSDKISAQFLLNIVNKIT